MPRYTLTEMYTCYRRYEIEADTPQQAKALWDNYHGDTAQIWRDEEVSEGDDYAIDYLMDDQGHDWSGEEIPPDKEGE